MRSAAAAGRVAMRLRQGLIKPRQAVRFNATAIATPASPEVTVGSTDKRPTRSKSLLFTQLDAALYPPSSSSKASTPAVHQVLSIVSKIISSENQAKLQSYHRDIVSALDPFIRSQPSLDSAQRERLEATLSYLWLAWIQKSGHLPWQNGSTGNTIFAEYCMLEAISASGDAKRLQQLRTYLAQTFKRIPVQLHGTRIAGAGGALVADGVVAFLQDRHEGWNPDVPFALPSIGELLNLPKLSSSSSILQALASTLGITSNEAQLELKQYLATSLEEKVLTSAASVEGRLRAYRRKGDYASIFELWERVRRQLAGDTSDPLRIDMTQQSEREILLAAFLYVFHAPVTPSTDPPAAAVDRERLKRLASRILAMAPKPLPLRIYHTLLSLSAEGAGVETASTADILAQLKGHWEDARKAGVVRDVKAYMLYIEGLGRRGDLQAVKEAWSEMTKDEGCKKLCLQSDVQEASTYPPVTALNQVISLCLAMPKATGGQGSALDLFHQTLKPGSTLRPNLTTINTVLRHYSRIPDMRAMLELFSSAGTLGLKPDIVTFTTLVQGFLKAQRPENAAKVINSMLAQGIQPNDRLYSMLIADLSQTGNRAMLAAAEDILAEMKRSNVPASVVTWTGLVSGYFRGGWVKEGFAAIQRMRHAGAKPNRVAYNMILRNVTLIPEGQVAGHGHYGDKSALDILQMMRSDGARPDADTWFILLDGLVRTRKWDEAKKALGEMEAAGFDHRGKAALRRLVQRVNAA